MNARNSFASVVLLFAVAVLHAQQSPTLAEAVKALYQNDFTRSEVLTTRFLKTHPAHSDGLVVLARAEMAQGKLDSAYQALAKALRAHPKHIDALYYLGRLSLLLSQEQYQELYALAPDSARAHQLLAESAQSEEDLAKAEEEYMAALRADAQSVEVLNALGYIQQRKFKFEEAVLYYSKAAAIQPRNYDSLYGLGSAYLYLQQPERAIEALREAVEVDPESHPARLALGDAFLRAGRYEEAVASLRASVEMHPDMRQAFVLLARAYTRLGKKEEASKASAKAAELQQKENERRVDLLRTEDVASPQLPPSSDPQEDNKPRL